MIIVIEGLDLAMIDDVYMCCICIERSALRGTVKRPLLKSTSAQSISNSG